MNLQRRYSTRLAMLCVIASSVTSNAAAYEPTPENLAAREGFRDAKLGVFIHWGVYSVLGRGEWVMHQEKISVADYEPLAERFDPTGFDADAWCRLFKEAGAKYITITTKHHDGFCMWDTDQTDWDIIDRTPYGRDVLKQLAEACGRHDLKLFFYHSQLDWRHPDYFPRGRTGRASQRPESGDFDRYIDYMNAQLVELLGGDYGDVAGIWFDGWWDQQSKPFKETSDASPLETRVDWRLEETYALIHRLQPACLIGANHHVTPFPGEDFQMFEKDLPGQNQTGFSADSVIGSLPLETCDTINKSWGYRSNDQSFKRVPELIRYLVRAAGNDANLLLNVGPKPDGTIDVESARRLHGLGDWLEQHGESIYGTRGGPVSPQPWGVATHDAETVYLHVLERPSSDDEWTTLAGCEAFAGKPLRLMESGLPCPTRRSDEGKLQVQLPQPDRDRIDTILIVERD